eukprot:gb/GECH01012630.1/.p1 GENE.gb/GECH01012630.1/~~gb/GECH01012630.1/.p1  ORF type:complete len:442 (+),score=92.89 gb/GECH01012630.1/:1-1326(+)
MLRTSSRPSSSSSGSLRSPHHIHTSTPSRIATQPRLIQQRTVFSSAEKVLQNELQSIKEAGTYKKERVITSPQAADITLDASDGSFLNFCSNNYLGLSSHPELIKAAHDALDSRGFGLSSVRFICGTQDIHKNLENTIAKFHRKDSSILYASCFDANAGLFETLLGPDDAVLSDALNHASIIDGIRLCKAKRFRYNHLDMKDLEEQLQKAVDAGTRLRLIATDGVFSMDGDFAPLDRIAELAQRYDAMVFVDDCHATGFIGKNGRGSAEYYGVEDEVDIVNSTLGKALGGSSGGYTAANASLIDLLRQRSRPYLFSNTLAPPIVVASNRTFEILSETSELRDTLAANTHHFRRRMTEAGFTLSGKEDCPIAPVMIGDARVASECADELLKQGIYVIGFSYPVVPKGQARIRVQLSAAHNEEQVDRAVDAFIHIGRKHNLIQ